jgi:hypothetical protein
MQFNGIRIAMCSYWQASDQSKTRKLKGPLWKGISVSTQNVLLLICAILVALPVLFATIWSFTCWLIAWLAGWPRLASVYRTQTSPTTNKSFDGVYGMVGISNYRGTLKVQVAPAGLHLSVIKIFRPGHPRLLIPWAALQNGQEWPYFWARAYRYDVMAPDRQTRLTTITLPQLIFEQAAGLLANPDAQTNR